MDEGEYMTDQIKICAEDIATLFPTFVNLILHHNGELNIERLDQFRDNQILDSVYADVSDTTGMYLFLLSPTVVPLIVKMSMMLSLTCYHFPKISGVP